VRELEDDQVSKVKSRPSTDARSDRESQASWSGLESVPSRPVGGGQVLALQRTAGNAAVSRLLADEEEQQAQSPSSVHDVVGKGGGEPLPKALRSTMESRFGQDFSSVRLHTDPTAAASARSVEAKAYTVGDDIVLGEHSPSPQSEAGQHTIAHELTHVVQQRSGPVDGTDVGDGIQVSDPSDRFEVQAESVADQVTSSGSVQESTPVSAAGAGAGSLQRQEETEGAEVMPVQRQGMHEDEEEEKEG
jgi:hypothetical protein